MNSLAGAAVHTVIESRASVDSFDQTRCVPLDVITQLVELATRAPSAYNLQNWRFLAVRSAPARARLRAAAFDQRKISDASVAFVICGRLDAQAELPAVLQPSVDDGRMSQPQADAWAVQAAAAHGDNPALQRDEAIRSASLAAMTLMLGAEAMGIATCPMSGFDASALSRAFDLPPQDVPVLIVAAGYPAPGARMQKLRRPLHDVLRLV